jgi:hypothetical protein
MSHFSFDNIVTFSEGLSSLDQAIPRINTFIRDGMAREGFARKTLKHHALKKGDVARIAVRKKDVGPGTSQVRQTYVYPNDFMLTGSVDVESIDLEQDPDVMVDVIIQILEATLVKEDMTWKKLADPVTQTVPGGSLDILLPKMLSVLKGNNVPAGMWLFGSKVYSELISDTSKILDPATKKDLVDGKEIHLFGMPFHSDYGRDESLRVLSPGDVYLIGKPEFVGAIFERKPLTLDIQSGAAIGRPIINIFWEQMESIGVANGRGIVKSRV